MRHRRVFACTMGALLALPGCRGFAPPRASTLERLRPMPLAALLPGRFELELRSPGLSGTFDAVCAATAQGARLQLFPDVGGKVLDLRLTGDAVVAELPGSRYEARAPLSAAEPHLALVIALLVAELLAPVVPARVLGERPAPADRAEVQLRPALGSGEVTAVLSAAGSVESYAMALSWVSVALSADGRFAGPGFSGQLRPAGGEPER